jgi:integrase
VHKIKPVTPAELVVLVANMPERYRAMTLLAAWCGLRFGELTELRRSDIDMKNARVRVRIAVTQLTEFDSENNATETAIMPEADQAVVDAW